MNSSERKAAKVVGIGLRSSPPRKVQKTSGAGSKSLVRNLSGDEDDTPAVAPADFVTVTDEAARWANLDKKTIREYLDDDGSVNEFALIYHLRHTFPLHFIVFKQTASHLSRTRATASSSSRARAPSLMTMARWTRRASRSGRPSA